MRTFVDTSALYALLDEDDGNHQAAARWLSGPGSEATVALVSHNYVVVETAALVQRRLGSAASKVLFTAMLPALSILFVDEHLHERAEASYLVGLSHGASLVDHVSFHMMRANGLERAFVFDQDFVSEGFDVVPQSL